MDYAKTCFVIMPFRRKTVGDVEIDFDDIYHRVFAPAIARVALPGDGGNLVPRRTDQDFSSGFIDHEMFQYLEYSRFALADLTGLNANVMYELGVRHRARQSGTALFRQSNVVLPFDVGHIKAFDYEYAPGAGVDAAQEVVVRVLAESLAREDSIDNGVWLSLLAQKAAQAPPAGSAPQPPGEVDELLRRAEQALLRYEPTDAVAAYREALERQPDNPLLHQRLGLLLKEGEQWEGALAHFGRALELNPRYAEAHREKGIVQNRLYWSTDPPSGPTGEDALRRAVELNPDDWDALSSLGGILRRAGDLQEAAAMYERATKVSRGHPYPLLNALKLRALASGAWKLDDEMRFHLSRAKRVRAAQAAHEPPHDAPWSLFDLAEIHLYSGEMAEALDRIGQAAELPDTGRAEVLSFRRSLGQLSERGLQVPGLPEVLAELDRIAGYL